MNSESFSQRFLELEKHVMALPREVSSAKLGKHDIANERLKPEPNGRGACHSDVLRTYFFEDAGPFPRFVSQKLQFTNMLAPLVFTITPNQSLRRRISWGDKGNGSHVPLDTVERLVSEMSAMKERDSRMDERVMRQFRMVREPKRRWKQNLM
eukprot:gb/GEZJ01001149.1/.p1 GENE.gb/GEZJ01001149.1/~~gb/GEZJ01001149.1/.p1  ORF type:complete len:153 (+),score=11.98 gb/GEZJ01001149.1/:1104-1562(+)